MQAGQLNQRVQLLAQTTVRGADYGDPQIVWAPIGTVWAAVEPLTGREYFAAQEQQSEVSIKVRIRWRTGVDDKCRVVHGAKTYEIASVIAPMSLRDELVLMCKEHRA